MICDQDPFDSAKLLSPTRCQRVFIASATRAMCVTELREVLELLCMAGSPLDRDAVFTAIREVAALRYRETASKAATV
jgi:hypothetical protein